METRNIEAFLAVAQELHFGRAAAHLHLTQSSVSQQLRRLERDLGLELVRRTSRSVSLTAAGRSFRVEARRILGDLADATTTARDIAAGQTGTVRIGFNGRAGQLVLPASLLELQARHPRIVTRLRPDRSGPQLAAIAGGRLDVGLAYGGPTHDPGLVSSTIVPLRIGVLVGPDHPWARRSSVAAGELADHPCVMFERAQSPALYDAIMAAGERAGAFPNVTDRIDDPASTEINVVARRLAGFASFVDADEPRPMGLVVVPIVDPEPVVTLDAIWRRDNANGALRAFLDAVGTIRAGLPAHGPVPG